MGKKVSADDDTKRKNPLQAVILANDFAGDNPDAVHTGPLGVPLLWPLTPTTTVLDATLHFLSSTGCQDVWILCATPVVREAVNVREESVNLRLHTLYDPSLYNAGDALRELDKRGVMDDSDTFILLPHGGLIASDAAKVAKLVKDALERHAERVKKDPAGTVLTMFLAQSDEDANPCVCLTAERRLVCFQEKCPDQVKIPTCFFAPTSSISIHSNLMDVGLDICSPTLLARFSDNFDYGRVRSEFVAQSVQEEDEALQNRIYAEQVESGCLHAVRTTRSYVDLCRRVLGRWVAVKTAGAGGCPIADPSFALVDYGAKQIPLASLQGPGAIGPDAAIDSGSSVLGSFIVGSQCRISAGAVVKDTIICGDNVQIEANALVEAAVLADDVIVREGAVVSRGCLIGAGCVVGTNVELPEYTRLTMQKQNGFGADDDDDDDWSSSSDDNDEKPDEGEDDVFESNTDVVGADGKGRLWTCGEEFAEEMLHGSIGYVPSPDTVATVSDDDSDMFSDEFNKEAGASVGESDDEYGGVVTFTNYDEDAPTFGRDKGVNVIEELTAICMEYELSSVSHIENLAIELNSFKFSQNATYSDCIIAAMTALLRRMNVTPGITDGKLVSSFKSSLAQWSPLLQKMSIGIEEEQAIIWALERCAKGDSVVAQVLSTGMSFRFLLQTVHDAEVVSEEAILAWAAERKGDSGDKALFYQMQPVQDFVEWLQQEDESDSDDDEEE